MIQMHLRQMALAAWPAAFRRPWPARQLSPLALAAATAGLAVAAAACSTAAPPRPPRDHGRVVALLPIPFRPAAPAGGRELITVTVPAGQRFSIKIDTSDGPFWWSQSSPPDPRIARLAGDFNQGSCAPGMPGCRVPYFHTLLARGTGSTTMTWTYHHPSCQAASSDSATCPDVSMVTFDITVR